jgi:RNA polymerase sigma-70 factor (ECF subfamily)
MTSLEFNSQLIGLENSLLKYAYYLNLKSDDAKDLVQETCLRILLNRHKYVDSQKFKAWAMTIMHNTFIDNYRKKFRNGTYSEQVPEFIFRSMVEPVAKEDPESIYSTIEISMKIDMLHEKLRTPLKMYIDGFKYAEIAKNLELNMGTVKNRIFLSRKKLMLQLNA